jgi:integrase/recombinase XerD
MDPQIVNTTATTVSDGERNASRVPVPLVISESRMLSIEERAQEITRHLGFNQSILGRRANKETLRVYCRDFYAYLEYAAWLTCTDCELRGTDPIPLALLPSTLARWMTELSDEDTRSPETGRPYSPNTINRMGSAVRRIMKEAGAQHYLDPDQVKGFHDVEGASKKAHKDRLRKDARFVPSPQQMRAITDRAKEEIDRLVGLRNIAILHTLASTGLRVDTFRLLRKDQLAYRSDLGYWCVRIMSKNEVEPRDVQMSHEADAAIEAWLCARPLDSDYLFTRFDGRGEGSHIRLTEQPLSAFSVRTIVKQAALSASVPQNVTSHTYRRFAGTRIAKEKGVKQAQLHLGHKQASTTLDNYVIEEPEAGIANELY